jgi:succinate dehydrogenase/fumarate reductase flavoprotein subunit
MSDSNTKGSMTRRDVVAGSLGIGALSFGAVGANASIGRSSGSWDLQADVVVIGTGAVGLPAAIIAKEAGSSVIMVEAEKHAGGHAMVSGGTIPLGGGTSAQKKYGIVDSPDLLFRDLTDWSVVEPNGFPDFRYNDREIVRAFADNAAPTYEWLAAHGVAFLDIVPGFF